MCVLLHRNIHYVPLQQILCQGNGVICNMIILKSWKKAHFLVDTLWRVCGYMYVPIPACIFTVQQNLYVLKLICKCIGLEKHTHFIKNLLHKICICPAETLSRSPFAHTDTARQTSCEFECKWASGWKLLQALH